MTLADDPDPARWRRARDIFDVLVDLPPADRGALLDQACGADLVLRHDIESLLRFDQSTADPIEHAVVGAAQAVAQESAWDTYLTVPESIGRYRVIARLGEGGMGEVFLAEDATLGRQVAVKRPGARLAGNPSARARLFREARAAATLNHPHVCVVYEVGEDATGRPFIAMEFVDGETLAARIRRGPLALDELVAIGRQAASALDQAHAKGVVHCDLKPSNIMLTTHGIKLVDFGLASIDGQGDAHPGTRSPEPAVPGPLTRTDRLAGTVPYMSPEQVRGDARDPRTDVYSLAVVLFEAATGRLPFDGATSPAMRQAILTDAPHRLEDMRPDLPPLLGALVARGLARNPADRFQRAHDLGTALAALAALMRA